jgi:hypothetical protein
MELLGFEIKRKKEDQYLPSFAPEQNDDGALIVSAGGSYGTALDLDGSVRSEADLVSKYREMAQQAEVNNAVEEIVNDGIVLEDDQKAVEIVLDDIKVSVAVKKAIQDEFNNILTLLDMNRHGYDVFRRWYVDGRLYYHVIIDDKKLDEGIQELRYIDPRKIRKVREVKKIRDKNNPYSPTIQQTVAEYYVYNDKGFMGRPSGISATVSTSGLRIAKDAVVYTPSGVTDRDGTMVLGYLHKAIKPLNCLRALEDATLIYAIARAPERRIFRVEVGSLPKIKAEQVLRDVMVKNKNRVTYDSSTGEIRDDRKFATMTEDYFFATRDGKGIEIDTLEGGRQLGEMEHVKYFEKKLYNSLNVPMGRIENESTGFPGMATEISHDELKFARFIDRIRVNFSKLFVDALEKQLILKNIVTIEEFDEFSKLFKFKWARDSYWEEVKEIGILTQRMNTLSLVVPFIGKYFSNKYVRTYILRQSEEDQKAEDIQIADELINPQFTSAEIEPDPNGIVKPTSKPGAGSQPAPFNPQNSSKNK